MLVVAVVEPKLPVMPTLAQAVVVAEKLLLQKAKPYR